MFDEILLSAVLIMLIASTWMGWSLRLAMHRSRQSLEALVKQIGALGLATLNVDRRLEKLEERVQELEK
jgi:hypothetical protein